MKIDDGGPAFPRNHTRVTLESESIEGFKGFDGMSLRDWFAGQADIPWGTARTFAKQWTGFPDPSFREIIEARTKLKFCEADTMLAERDKTSRGSSTPGEK